MVFNGAKKNTVFTALAENGHPLTSPWLLPRDAWWETLTYYRGLHTTLAYRFPPGQKFNAGTRKTSNLTKVMYQACPLDQNGSKLYCIYSLLEILFSGVKKKCVGGGTKHNKPIKLDFPGVMLKARNLLRFFVCLFFPFLKIEFIHLSLLIPQSYYIWKK